MSWWHSIFDYAKAGGGQESGGGMFGINLGISPGEWFGEDRPDEVRARNEELQKEYAQNSIQWRVADAKAAGLHPLFGLSGGGSSYSPNPVTVSDSTSLSISPGEGIRRRNNQQALPMSEMEKDQNARLERQANNDHASTISRISTDTAQQELLRAQTDLVREQIIDSQKARGAQVGTANKERAVTRPLDTDPQDAFEIKPREVTQGTTASGGAIAVGPAGSGFEPVWIAPGIPALVPNGAAQNLGDMELSGWLISAAATMAWWGEAAAQKVIQLARKAGHVITSQEVSDYRRKHLTADTGGGAP